MTKGPFAPPQRAHALCEPSIDCGSKSLHRVVQSRCWWNSPGYGGMVTGARGLDVVGLPPQRAQRLWRSAMVVHPGASGGLGLGGGRMRRARWSAAPPISSGNRWVEQPPSSSSSSAPSPPPPSPPLPCGGPPRDAGGGPRGCCMSVVTGGEPRLFWRAWARASATVSTLREASMDSRTEAGIDDSSADVLRAASRWGGVMPVRVVAWRASATRRVAIGDGY